jgi:hypothetical protein
MFIAMGAHQESRSVRSEMFIANLAEAAKGGCAPTELRSKERYKHLAPLGGAAISILFSYWKFTFPMSMLRDTLNKRRRDLSCAVVGISYNARLSRRLLIG